jgi:hypothetical protein
MTLLQTLSWQKYFLRFIEHDCSWTLRGLQVKADLVRLPPVDFQWTTQRYILEDRTLHNRRCENLRSCKSRSVAFPHLFNYLKKTVRFTGSTFTAHKIRVSFFYTTSVSVIFRSDKYVARYIQKRINDIRHNIS